MTMLQRLWRAKLCKDLYLVNPRQLTNAHKQAHFETCGELCEFHTRDKTFLERIVTGDDTWVYPYEPESKKQRPWNGATQHFQEQKISRVSVQLEKLWQLCFSSLTESYS